MDNLAATIPDSGVSALLIVTFSAESNTNTFSRIAPPSWMPLRVNKLGEGKQN